MAKYTPITQEALNAIAPVDPCEYDDELMHIEEALEECIEDGNFETAQAYQQLRNELMLK